MPVFYGFLTCLVLECHFYLSSPGFWFSHSYSMFPQRFPCHLPLSLGRGLAQGNPLVLWFSVATKSLCLASAATWFSARATSRSIHNVEFDDARERVLSPSWWSWLPFGCWKSLQLKSKSIETQHQPQRSTPQTECRKQWLPSVWHHRNTTWFFHTPQRIPPSPLTTRRLPWAMEGRGGPKGLELSSDHEAKKNAKCPPLAQVKKGLELTDLETLFWGFVSMNLHLIIIIWHHALTPSQHLYKRNEDCRFLEFRKTAGVIGWDGDMLTIYGLPLALLVRWYRRVLPSISISKVLGDGCWYQFWCNWAWWIIVGQIIPRWPYPHENATFYQWVYHCLKLANSEMSCLV